MDAETGIIGDTQTAAAPAKRGMAKRLQFSGLMQYVPPFGVALVVSGIALVLAPWIGPRLDAALTVIAGLFLARGLFDLIVIKYRLIVLPDRSPRPVTGSPFRVIKARRACRSFQPRGLSGEHEARLREILADHETPGDDSLTTSPIRAERITGEMNVWLAVGATQFLVIIGPKAYDRLAVIEAGRRYQHVVHDLTEAGLATGWIGPGADQQAIEAALGDRFDPTRDHVLALIAIGYASRYRPMMAALAGVTHHMRKPLSALVFDTVPDLPAPLTQKPWKHFTRAFDACRAAPSSYNTQTSRLICEFQAGRFTKAGFATVTESKFYAPLALGIWAAHWEIAMQAQGIAGEFTPLPQPENLSNDFKSHMIWHSASTNS